MSKFVWMPGLLLGLLFSGGALANNALQEDLNKMAVRTEPPVTAIRFSWVEGPVDARIAGPEAAWKVKQSGMLEMKMLLAKLPKIEFWQLGRYVEVTPLQIGERTYRFNIVPAKIRFTLENGNQSIWTIDNKFVTGEAPVEALSKKLPKNTPPAKKKQEQKPKEG